jgi:WD40 repeat protein
MYDMVSSLFQSRGPYSLAARLHGHSKGIYSLAISPKGDLLASGGTYDSEIPRHDMNQFASRRRWCPNMGPTNLYTGFLVVKKSIVPRPRNVRSVDNVQGRVFRYPRVWHGPWPSWNITSNVVCETFKLSFPKL